MKNTFGQFATLLLFIMGSLFAADDDSQMAVVQVTNAFNHMRVKIVTGIDKAEITKKIEEIKTQVKGEYDDAKATIENGGIARPPKDPDTIDRITPQGGQNAMLRFAGSRGSFAEGEIDGFKSVSKLKKPYVYNSRVFTVKNKDLLTLQDELKTISPADKTPAKHDYLGAWKEYHRLLCKAEKNNEDVEEKAQKKNK